MLSRRGSLAVTHLDPVEVFYYLGRKHNPYMADEGVDYDYNTVRLLLEEEITKFNECSPDADEHLYDMVTMNGSYSCVVMTMSETRIKLRCSNSIARDFPLIMIK